MKRKWLYILIAVLTVLCFGLFAYTVDPKLDPNGDNATYIRLARALADGQGYTEMTVDGRVPASHFPPGYPALLSVLIRLGLDSLMAFKIFNGICLWLAVLGLFVIVRGLTGQTYLAFAVSALTFMSPNLLHVAGIVMSEMSYMLATVLALLSLYMYGLEDGKRAEAGGVRPFWRSPWFYTAVLCGAGAYYVRTVGAAVLFAIVVFYLFRKEWWAALASAGGTVLCLLPWSLRNAAYGIESRYLGTVMTVNPWRPEEGSISSVGEMLDKMFDNVRDTVIQGFKALLFPFDGAETGFWAWFFGLLVVAVVFYGVWHMGRMRWAMMAFLLGHIGLFALWHGGNGTRYVIPLIPYLFAFFYTGVWAAWNRWVRRYRRGGASAGLSERPDRPAWLLLLVLLLPMTVPVQARHEKVREPYPAAYRHYFNLARMVQNSVPKGTVVCCRKPDLFMYFAPDVIATNYLYDLDPAAVLRDMVDRQVDYVVVEQLGYPTTVRYLYPALRDYPDLFARLYVSPAPATTLVKFDREAARALLFPAD